MPKTMFYLERLEDVSCVSGTGIVAIGVVFPSGRCVLEWIGAHKSLGIYDSIGELLEIHGHHGKTRIRWIDLGSPISISKSEEVQ